MRTASSRPRAEGDFTPSRPQRSRQDKVTGRPRRPGGSILAAWFKESVVSFRRSIDIMPRVQNGAIATVRKAFSFRLGAHLRRIHGASGTHDPEDSFTGTVALKANRRVF